MDSNGHPVRVGIMLGSYPAGTPSLGEVVAVAEEAEALGFSGVWAGDHVSFHTPILDPLMLLAALASRTQKITLGTAVYLLPLRHPVPVAKAVASLDYLSGGRVTFGIGIGGESPKEYRACGVPLQERGRRADEGIEVIKWLWQGSSGEFRGRFFEMEDITIEPRPAQKPHPPIWVGGRSEGALKRAALLGDGWISYLATPERFHESTVRIEQYARLASRRLDSFGTAHVVFTALAGSRLQALAGAVPLLERDFGRPFQNAAERYGVFGDPIECVEKLNAFVSAGARHLILRLICKPSEMLSQLRQYARDVLPHLASPRAEMRTLAAGSSGATS